MELNPASVNLGLYTSLYGQAAVQGTALLLQNPFSKKYRTFTVMFHLGHRLVPVHRCSTVITLIVSIHTAVRYVIGIRCAENGLRQSLARFHFLRHTASFLLSSQYPVHSIVIVSSQPDSLRSPILGCHILPWLSGFGGSCFSGSFGLRFWS